MIEVLRGAAGELTDLVEARLTQGSDQRSSPPRKEENTGLSSGPLPAQEERKTAAAVKEPSEYSYVTEAEESKKDEADDPEVEKNTETPKIEGGEKVEPQDTKDQESQRKERLKNFDPHYLTNRLFLKPVPKPHSGKDRKGRDQDSRKRPVSAGREQREGSGAAGSAPDGKGAALIGQDEEDSQGRQPLARRKPQRSRSRKRGTRGAKKRERSKAFREKKIEERRAKKAQKGWHPRRKPRQWPEGARCRPAACSDVAEAWEAGEEVPLSGLPLDFVKPGLFLVVTEGEYFGAAAKVAGKVQRVELEPEATFLMMKLTGTNNEEILKAYTGAMEKAFKVHLCPPDCGRVEVGALFLHGMKGRKGLPVGEEAWTSNLETGPAAEEDELAILRERKAGLEARGVQPQVGEGCQAGASPEKGDVEESKKKKKKKKKEREKEDKLHSGRQPAKAGQKEASQLFAGTALDPKERVRKRVLRKAQRFAARKKYKRSSSSDTSGSSSSSVTTDDGVNIVEGVFTEETKTKAVAERFPGALAMETLMSMRRSLLTTAGEEGEEQSTRPVALLYFRNTLARRAGGRRGASC